MVQFAYSTKQQGFAIALSDWWQRLADVIVRGQGGYNSRWMLQAMPCMLVNYKPDLTVLWLGNNDSYEAPPDADGDDDKGYPPAISHAEFESNMRKIISTLREKNPNMVIILLTPTTSLRPSRSDSFTEPYAGVIRTIASEGDPNIALLDLFAESSPYKITHADQHDKLHLNAAGNHKVAEGIKAIIRSKYPQFAPFSVDKTVGEDESVRAGVVGGLKIRLPRHIHLRFFDEKESLEKLQAAMYPSADPN